jgi:hypothetical protein
MPKIHQFVVSAEERLLQTFISLGTQQQMIIKIKPIIMVY